MILHGQGERSVSVMVDGSMYGMDNEGVPDFIGTKVVDNVITLEKCNEVAQMIRDNYKVEPKMLNFMLDIYSETGEPEEELLLNKKALYDVGLNRLRIWEDRVFVYENSDGEICDDPVELSKAYYPSVPTYHVFATAEIKKGVEDVVNNNCSTYESVDDMLKDLDIEVSAEGVDQDGL